jgi:hypothetical protein
MNILIIILNQDCNNIYVLHVWNQITFRIEFNFTYDLNLINNLLEFLYLR